MIVNIPNVGPVRFPDDMSDADLGKAIDELQANDYEPQKQSWFANHPSLEQGVRSTTNMLSSVPEMLVDLPYQAMAWGDNKVRNAFGMSPYTGPTTPVADAKRKWLESVGVNPNPANKAEEILQTGLNSAMGAGSAARTAGSKLLDAVDPYTGANVSSIGSKAVDLFKSKPIAQAGGAITGAAAGEYARESGLPEWAQIAANVGGNVAGSGMTGMAEGIGSGIGAAGKAMLSDAEKQAIAARAFYRQASNPDLVIDRLSNPALNREILPGSKPITAEIAQDPGLSSLNKAFGGNEIATSMGLDQINANRYADIANAANNALDVANRRNVLKGGQDVLNYLDSIKSKAYSKFADGKDLFNTPVDVAPVYDEIQNLKQQYAGRSSVEKFLTKTEKNLMPDGNDYQPFNRVWNARQDIDEKIYGVKSDYTKAPSIKQTYDSAGKNIRSTINDELRNVDPEFDPFLRRYANASRYSDAIRTGRQLQNKLDLTQVGGASNATDLTGVNRMSAAKSKQIQDQLTDLAGNDTALASMLTPRQLRTFQNVNDEVKRSLGLELPRTGDSITANILTRGGLLSNDIIDDIIGAQQGSTPGLLRDLGQGISQFGNKIGITQPFERDVMSHVGKAAIDPNYALDLMQIGRNTARGPLNLKRNALDLSKAGLISALYNGLN